MMPRSLSSDNSVHAVLPGAKVFFSFNLATTMGSKSANTSLHHKLSSYGREMARQYKKITRKTTQQTILAHNRGELECVNPFSTRVT